jgi:DNA (cytosine-5)-methyltransferase 1
MTKKYCLLDLFSGAGGLSVGFERTGRFKVVGAVEINKAAQKTFIMNHNGNEDLILKSPETNISDITKINFHDLRLNPKETVIIGGPPCQGFSNANRQKNYLISGNNKLVKEFARAIKEVKPAAFLMENVKSISSQVHKFFVTKPILDYQKDFSSKRHLDEISSGLPLYQEDYIELLISSNNNLKSIIAEFDSVSNVPLPFINEPLLLTRLRSLERKIKKGPGSIIKNDKEKRELESIISLITSNFNSAFKDLLDKVLEELNGLLTGSLESNSKYEYVKVFIELNRFLIRCEELREENIECDLLSINNEDKFKVEVKVYSYNVIEYLETLFGYLGYDIDKGILDSSGFGVAQKRKRFLMMGIYNSTKEVKLPRPNLSKDIYTVKDAIGDLEDIEPQQDIENYTAGVYNTKTPANELLDYFREGLSKYDLYDHINTKSSALIKERYHHILELKGKNFHSLPDELKKSYSDASRTQNTVYLRLEYDEPSPTVINVRKSMWQHPTKARALSIREAARLQSFPDSYKFYGNKDERYQQIGNAVPPKLAEAVAENILKLL